MALQLSPIAWGAWRLAKAQLSAQELNGLIHQCVALGITSFDHADIYGGFSAEGLFGRAMALSPGLRQQVQLLTKSGIAAVSPLRSAHRIKTYDSSAAYIASCVDASLLALQTDHVDLLMIHRPDFLMDAKETAHALASAVQAGKVLHIGVSNFSPSQVALLQQFLPHLLAVNQVELSLAARQPLHDGVLDQCQQLGIVPMAWSPLAGGALFGQSELALRLAPELQRIAAAHSVRADAVALAWLLRLPSAVIPVVGSVKIARLRSAWAATQINLSRDDWYSLYVAATGQALP